ncbi:acyl-CoA dehydrogenase family protein [Catenulispora rubra]|uniref:acyl-CoA dehydrogenase family protein n=1 Tax=Catenulispora rubra TaxID=280293 RepID=UPI0018922113|nr:acyl-CoA dehydrogenase family protein [Catenulispora rubra]
MSTSTLPRAGMADCERTGREAGLAAGLASALSGISVVDTAPGRYAAVPASPDDGAAVFRHRLADAEGVVFLECPGQGPEAGPTWTEVGRLLAAVRLGVLRGALDRAVEHLSGRLSGGEPLVRKQLITGAIADVMAGTEMLRAYAQTQGGPAALADVHTRLDVLGWEVLKLFGAAGYLADSPGRALYVSALVAGTWVPREEVSE